MLAAFVFAQGPAAGMAAPSTGSKVSPQARQMTERMSQPGEPALKILFIANTRGLTEPCPVCGNRALGGLARRSTLLAELREACPAAVFVTGPYEFSSPPRLEAVSISRPGERVPPALLRAAYEYCSPDAGYLTRDEALLFQETGKLPRGFAKVADMPVTKRIRIGTADVAVILLPEMSGETARMTPQLLAASLEAGQAAADADLVIGVSPWGFTAEGQVLERLNGVFDVLLGGGPGAPFPIDVTAFAPGVVWARSDGDGRNIIELTFDFLPGMQRPWPWIRGVDVKGRELALDPAIHDDPRVRAVLGRK